MAEGGIGASQERQDASARLGKPYKFPKQSAGRAGGERACGKGEPLEHDTGEISGERGDGAQGSVDTLADERGRCERIKDRFGADEKASRAQGGGDGGNMGGEDT